jgi:hypothetical protein
VLLFDSFSFAESGGEFDGQETTTASSSPLRASAATGILSTPVLPAASVKSKGSLTIHCK